MDVRDINNTFIAADCARTNGTDTIDGVAVTGVQIHADKDDAGAAATTYYGAGELVVTDTSGRVLNATTAVKAVEAIVIHQRSADGTSHFTSPAIKGANITSYSLIPYKAPVEQVASISAIDATKTDFNYMIKIRKLGSDVSRMQESTVKTAYFKTSTAGNTATEILTGLADYINRNWNDDLLVPVKASVIGAGSDELLIEALPYEYEPYKFKYEKLNFAVELVNFDATVQTNLGQSFTDGASTTHAIATKGAGNYEQVSDLELFGKLYTGANKDVTSPGFKRTIVPLDVVTGATYDTLVIGWVNKQGDFSQNVRQEGNLTIFLPTANNGTNQVIDIVNTLDNYIVTEYGVGVAQAGNLS